MAEFNMHSIKRAARKEAWYSDSWNPFRKNMPRRSKTWTVPSEPTRLDEIEAAIRTGIDTSLSGVQTEPTSSAGGLKSPVHLSNSTDAVTNSYQPPSPTSEHAGDAIETAVERQSSRPIPEPRRRIFHGRFLSKSAGAWLNTKTQIRRTEHESWDLKPQELFWDPFESLSEKPASNAYRHAKAPAPDAFRQGAVNTKSSLKRELEPRGISASRENSEIERHDIDIRCIQITAKGKLTITGGTDERLLEKESFGEYLKQTLGMLRIDLQIFQSLSAKSKAFSQAQDELLANYEFLAKKVLQQIEQNTMSIPVITAMIGK